MENYAQIGDKFLLGADYLGRDLLSRIIYGTRVSLPVGFMGAMTALMIGLVYGCISGYYGGKVDNIMMRIVDIMYAFPTMLLIILLMAFFKTSFGGAAAAGHRWPIRLTRSTMWWIGSWACRAAACSLSLWASASPPGWASPAWPAARSSRSRKKSSSRPRT